MHTIATFHHLDFADIDRLVRVREHTGVSVSLCIPSLNEEETIGEVVRILKGTLMEEHHLLDEIVVIDSGSTDRTLEVAANAGAEVFTASEILPELSPAKGKGENIWKSLHQVRGDIICFVDGDVRNMHPRFVYGPLGALLHNPGLQYVKAFYERPGAASEQGRPAGGGRVTEALVRPLFSMFCPELSGLIQPLSGEYAAWRGVLESIPMPAGYGVETAHLMDIAARWGADSIGQCDLEERIHRHQGTASLGRMSFSILQAFFRRMEAAGKLTMTMPPGEMYRRFVIDGGGYETLDEEISGLERPPMISVPEYQKKFGSRAERGGSH